MGIPIHISRKLQKFLGIKDRELAADRPEHPLGPWNAHLFPYHGKRTLILTNKASCFTLLFPAAKKRELQDFQPRFHERLEKQLEYERLLPQAGSKAIDPEKDETHLLRTDNDQRTLGVIRDFIFQFEIIDPWLAEGPTEQQLLDVTHQLNTTPVMAGKGKNAFWPTDEMAALLGVDPPPRVGSISEPSDPQEDEARELGGKPPIHELEVRLKGVEPAVRRRLLVSGEVSLLGFHYVLQKALGWENAHLHAFHKDGKPYTHHFEQESELDTGMKDHGELRLMDLLKEEGDAMEYEYDFGDSWFHSIELVKLHHQPDPNLSYPHCLDGEGACPPEDCGGIDGYREMMRILNDPKDPEHRSMLEWTGGGHDPSDFDRERTDRSLRS